MGRTVVSQGHAKHRQLEHVPARRKGRIWNRITSASMLTLVPVLTMFVLAFPNLTGSLSEGGMKE